MKFMKSLLERLQDTIGQEDPAIRNYLENKIEDEATKKVLSNSLVSSQMNSIAAWKNPDGTWRIWRLVIEYFQPENQHKYDSNYARYFVKVSDNYSQANLDDLKEKLFEGGRHVVEIYPVGDMLFSFRYDKGALSDFGKYTKSVAVFNDKGDKLKSFTKEEFGDRDIHEFMDEPNYDDPKVFGM